MKNKTKQTEIKHYYQIDKTLKILYECMFVCLTHFDVICIDV